MTPLPELPAEPADDLSRPYTVNREYNCLIQLLLGLALVLPMVYHGVECQHSAHQNPSTGPESSPNKAD